MGDGARQRMKRRVLRVRRMRELAGGAYQIGKYRVDFGETPLECRQLGAAYTWMWRSR